MLPVEPMTRGFALLDWRRPRAFVPLDPDRWFRQRLRPRGIRPLGPRPGFRPRRRPRLLLALGIRASIVLDPPGDALGTAACAGGHMASGSDKRQRDETMPRPLHRTMNTRMCRPRPTAPASPPPLSSAPPPSATPAPAPSAAPPPTMLPCASSSASGPRRQQHQPDRLQAEHRRPAEHPGARAGACRLPRHPDRHLRRARHEHKSPPATRNQQQGTAPPPG